MKGRRFTLSFLCDPVGWLPKAIPHVDAFLKVRFCWRKYYLRLLGIIMYILSAPTHREGDAMVIESAPRTFEPLPPVGWSI
jgi:hypothetical protein